MKRSMLLSAVLSLSAYGANAATLTTGGGDGGVTVDTDVFGRAVSAIYNPVGDLGPAETFFESSVFFQTGTVRVNAGFNEEVLEQTDSSVVSRFFVNNLEVTLTQTLASSMDQGLVTGSLFQQSYSIRNTADVPNSFDVVRYLDGDLGFDDSIDDGGGVIELGGTRVLYETDAAEGAAAASTFVGINTSANGNIGSQRFEIAPYSGLRERIENGFDLENTIVGDTDNDGFIDTPYDVTLGLQDTFRLEADQVVQWTTNTIFGNAVPPRPGSTEALPLLPSPDSPEGQFFFEIDPDQVVEGEIIFIDPVIAVGYTYEITGADFASVQAPSFAAVPDNEYTLIYDDGTGEVSVTLVSGQLFNFSVAGIRTFRIEGIDQALMLDPTNPTAFVTGIALQSISGQPILVSQTPINFTTGTNPVPLPAGAWLMGTALAVGAAARRKKKA